MVQINLLVANYSDTTLIEDIKEVFSADTLKKAVGLAIMEAHRVINKQYDAPVVMIGGIQLSDAHVNKLRKSYIDFQLEFPIIRETLMASLAFTSDEAKVQYMRDTDRNGIFKNQKDFSIEQLAAQAKANLRVTRDVVRWAKADATASVVPSYVEERRAIEKAAAQQKRIASKSVGK